MFYTNSENVPQSVHAALDTMSDCQGLKVSDMMFKVSRSLDKATAGSRHNPVDLEDGDPMMVDSNDGEVMDVCFGNLNAFRVTDF